MVYYSTDFITPSSKHHKQLRRRLSLTAARTDNDRVATAASSWHQQWKQLVEKAAVGPEGLRLAIRAMSWRGAWKCSLAINSSLTDRTKSDHTNKQLRSRSAMTRVALGGSTTELHIVD